MIQQNDYGIQLIVLCRLAFRLFESSFISVIPRHRKNGNWSPYCILVCSVNKRRIPTVEKDGEECMVLWYFIVDLQTSLLMLLLVCITYYHKVLKFPFSIFEMIILWIVQTDDAQKLHISSSER